MGSSFNDGLCLHLAAIPALQVGEHQESRMCTQAGNGGRVTVVSTQAAASVRDNVVTVFGSRTVEGLDAFQASLSTQSPAQALGYAPT